MIRTVRLSRLGSSTLCFQALLRMLKPLIALHVSSLLSLSSVASSPVQNSTDFADFDDVEKMAWSDSLEDLLDRIDNASSVTSEAPGMDDMQSQLGTTTHPLESSISSYTTESSENGTRVVHETDSHNVLTNETNNSAPAQVTFNLEDATIVSQHSEDIRDNMTITTPPQSMPRPALKFLNRTTITRVQYRLYAGKKRRKCRKYTDQQKYLLLEGVGGRNQQFMANSADEAARNFQRLLPSMADPIAIMYQDADGILQSDPLSNRLVDPHDCDWQCMEIRAKLEMYMELKKSQTLSDISGPFGDDHSEVVDSETAAAPDAVTESASVQSNVKLDEGSAKKKNRNKPCKLEKFIPIGNCTMQGEEEVLDHEKLCSACQGVFVLNPDCFPAFLNAVNCDNAESRCVFDHYTKYAQGLCQSRTLSFKVMRNKGSSDCEDWEFVYIDIPVACECFLSKTSFLDAMPTDD